MSKFELHFRPKAAKAVFRDCVSPRNALAPGAQYELPNVATSNAALNFRGAAAGPLASNLNVIGLT